MTAPTRYALVPVEATCKMTNAWSHAKPSISADRWTDKDCAEADWSAMLAASPNGGAVTAADLERAAEAAFEKRRELLGAELSYSWAELPSDWRAVEIASQRAALTALGLPVADAPAGEVVDG